MNAKKTPKELPILSHLLCRQGQDEMFVAFCQDGRKVNFGEFQTHVKSLCTRLLKSNGMRWVVAEDNAYALAVGIFAVLHAGKSAVLPSNLQSGHLTQLIDRADGVISGNDIPNIPNDALPIFANVIPDELLELEPIEDERAEILIHTSGTTGDALEISKPLRCLNAEVIALEQTFGRYFSEPPTLSVYATVPAYHIYGLLFRILWPLASGRPFSGQLFSYPEELISISNDSAPSILVSSPAFLKRAYAILGDDYLHSNQVFIFSSGGPLPTDVALSYNTALASPIVEVYGSTETGGIGYRSQMEPSKPNRWKPLPGVELKINSNEETLSVRSTFLSTPDWMTTSDRAHLDADGCFSLAGRVDQIVKIEELRVSLSELERRLSNCQEIDTVRILPLTGRKSDRQILGAVVQLSDDGWNKLYESGKNTLTESFKATLQFHVRAIALPRKWRFVKKIPENAQGKTTVPALEALFRDNQGRTTEPIILERQDEPDTVTLRLQLQKEISYFDGHFDEEAILAGVVQVDWAIEYAQNFFSIPGIFQRIEALKFFKVQFADQRTSLELRYAPDRNRIYFRYFDDDAKYSSGRIVFE